MINPQSFLLCSVISIQVIAFAQPLTSPPESPTPEELAAFNRSGNKVSRTQLAIKQTRIYLDAYYQESGIWPNSWKVVEDKFGSSIWESPEVRQSFITSFVLLEGVAGHMKTREEGEYDATMMMVMASPIERKLDADKHELGRWAVWKTFRGQIVTRWHPEEEITSFSEWPKVQVIIKDHVKNFSILGKASAKSRLRPPSVSNAWQKNKSIADSVVKHEETEQSTPWPVVTVVSVAVIALLWLLVKKRNDRPSK
jgi:hypothetical protein